MSDSLNNLPWQTWKLNDFSSAKADAPETVAVIPPMVSLSLDEANPGWQQELATLRQQAQSEGLQQGIQQGQKQGYDAGYQAGLDAGKQQGLLEAQLQQKPLTEHWQGLVTEFQHTLDALDSVIASRLMQMALTAAKQILGQAPLCDGTALLAQIQQLIQQEPLFTGTPQLRVNPQDFERVEQQLGVTLSLHNWRLLADNQIHPGGCKVSAEDGDLDASIATRWHELCRLAAPGDL
ncbi:flagellar assembly protein FliH [Edaphovirga cremea]|uniref:flagellar assembly protein FliH n=1 Tax=Edaphovirga cremea TaxID=2267246 RepID=UPI000DEF99B1|nr:flagellar assembly protein FliH [Edaphovirga cremea]